MMEESLSVRFVVAKVVRVNVHRADGPVRPFFLF